MLLALTQMPWKRHVLVVANVTATSPELIETLVSRARTEPCRITLLVPATAFGGGRQAAPEQLADAIGRLQEAGLDAEGLVGDSDPCVAVTEVWDPKRHDEIMVSTLPMRLSKWLHAGLPERIERLTGAPVSHLVSAPPKPAVRTSPAPAHNGQPLGPLAVLGWGRSRAHQPPPGTLR